MQWQYCSGVSCQTTNMLKVCLVYTIATHGTMRSKVSGKHDYGRRVSKSITVAAVQDKFDPWTFIGVTGAQAGDNTPPWFLLVSRWSNPKPQTCLAQCTACEQDILYIRAWNNHGMGCIHMVLCWFLCWWWLGQILSTLYADESHCCLHYQCHIYQ